MTSRDFCFWLQGWFELNDAGTQDGPPGLSAAQTEMVRRHLALVFRHEIDPPMGDKPALDFIHFGSAGFVGPPVGIGLVQETLQPFGSPLFRC